MKCIIAGGRFIRDYKKVEKAMNQCGFQRRITEVVHGDAKGVDWLAGVWADKKGIPKKRFDAYWDDLDAPGAIIEYHPNGRPYNKKAGPDRNQRMADYADALVLIWNGRSRGSKDMLERAEAAGLYIYQKITV